MDQTMPCMHVERGPGETVCGENYELPDSKQSSERSDQKKILSFSDALSKINQNT